MKLPNIQGVIRRRILVNYRVDPDVIQRLLPSRFRPKLHAGAAVAGICLIRLEQIRPGQLPGFLGLSSENAAHRVAVHWDEDGQSREGVFIPRRDTNSLLNRVAGGRLFPGEHHPAQFRVRCDDRRIDLMMNSRDGDVRVEVRGTIAEGLPPYSRFASLDEASRFFEPGSTGYSVTRDKNRLDGVRLATRSWRVEALVVEHVYSSYYADEALFPKGSIVFDSALLMRNIEHEWHSAPDLYV